MVMSVPMTRSIAWPSGPPLHVSYRRGCCIFADDLPAEIHEGFVHICSSPRARLVVVNVSPALADGKCSRFGDHPVFFQVALVAHYDQWHLCIIFDANDLIAEFVKFGEGAERCDGEDKKKALAGFHVEFPHGSWVCVSPSSLYGKPLSLTKLLRSSGI